MNKTLFVITLLMLNCSLGAVTINISELRGKAESLLNEEVTIQGLLVGVCRHGGKKAFIRDSEAMESNTLRIECKEAKPFDRTLVGNVLAVRGVVREMRIDHDYLMKWEAHARETDPEHQHDESGGCSDCQGKAPASDDEPTVFERIAEMRTRIEQSERGYLPVYWIEASSWEVL